MIVKIFLFSICLISAFTACSSVTCGSCIGNNNGVTNMRINLPCDGGNNFPKNRNLINCPRFSPININTSAVQYIQTRPLIFTKEQNTKARITNGPAFLEVKVIVEPGKQVASLRSGIVYNDIYLFSRDQIYWAENVCGLVGNRIDSYGASVEVHSHYYKQNYGSFDNAKNYPDGLISTVTFVRATPDPNPVFDKFASDIICVQANGASKVIDLATARSWYNVFNTTRTYFAYPAQYAGQDGKNLDSLVVVVYPSSTSEPHIGIKQFEETYLQLKSNYRLLPSTAFTIFRSCGRPVICTNGIFDFNASSR